MANQELAKQEVLELNVDFDSLIQDFELDGTSEQEIEIAQNGFIFYITFTVSGRVSRHLSGLCEYNDHMEDVFEGKVYPIEIHVLDPLDNEYELRVSKQIKEQLTEVR